MKVNLQPIKGFRDLYPEDKNIQNYIFEKLINLANESGFEQFDGPLLEPVEIYLNKSSEELVNKQTFQVIDKNNKTLVMRPEMTPSLARMIASKDQQLVFPLKTFNLGLRFRYEAPQKGRAREFYQADFDILGEEGILADVEILNTAVNVFKYFGATYKDFTLCINSREFMQRKLLEVGVTSDKLKEVISIIDKKEKIKSEVFEKLLLDISIEKNVIVKIDELLKSDFSSDDYFSELFKLLKVYDIDKFVRIDLNIVRGLDYYTGLVFEIKEIGEMNRSLLGGGRYDNLVSDFGASRKIPGIGFATSDVAIWEFLKDKDLIPKINSKKIKFLITVFDKESVDKSIELLIFLRKNNIACEIYPSIDKKLEKQIKYADKNKIPYVIILGPEEIKKNVAKIKNMITGEQKEIDINKIVNLNI
jgi:histidyl-tRNA synthetase